AIRIERDEMLVEGDAENMTFSEQQIAGDAAPCGAFVREFPEDGSIVAVERVNVAGFSGVGADINPIANDDRVTVKLCVIAGVVSPENAARAPLIGTEYAGTRACIERLAHDRGRCEHSAAGIGAPQNR